MNFIVLAKIGAADLLPLSVRLGTFIVTGFTNAKRMSMAEQ
jgi:hypothetical protein